MKRWGRVYNTKYCNFGIINTTLSRREWYHRDRRMVLVNTGIYCIYCTSTIPESGLGIWVSSPCLCFSMALSTSTPYYWSSNDHTKYSPVILYTILYSPPPPPPGPLIQMTSQKKRSPRRHWCSAVGWPTVIFAGTPSIGCVRLVTTMSSSPADLEAWAMKWPVEIVP